MSVFALCVCCYELRLPAVVVVLVYFATANTVVVSVHLCLHGVCTCVSTVRVCTRVVMLEVAVGV
jgi:hypothetical protein